MVSVYSLPTVCRHVPRSQAREREEAGAWFPLLAHVLNCSRIPLALWTIDLCGVKADTQC